MMHLTSNLLFAVSFMVAASLGGCGWPDKSPYVSRDEASLEAAPPSLKIGTPYKIRGRLYRPEHDPGYVEEGYASWYGPGFHGRSTANGERFDQNALTAAHRTLPMPSMVKVTNLENGRSAMVRVNDRGPFKDDRIIDLSKKAAEELGTIQNGVAKVRVEYLPDESKRMIETMILEGKLKADPQSLEVLSMAMPSDIAEVELDTPPLAALAALDAPGQPISSTAVQAPVLARNLAAPPVTAQAAPSTVALREEQMIREERDPDLLAAEEKSLEDKIKAIQERASQRVRQPKSLGVIHDAQAEADTISNGDLDVAISQRLDVPEGQEELPVPLTSLAQESPEVGDVQDIAAAPEQMAALEPAAASQELFEAAVPEPDAILNESSGIAQVYVQAASFSDAGNAQGLADQLSEVGQASVQSVDINGYRWYRVRLGPYEDTARAPAVLHQVRNMGFADARMIYE